MEITVFEDQFLGNSDSVKHKRVNAIFTIFSLMKFLEHNVTYWKLKL